MSNLKGLKGKFDECEKINQWPAPAKINLCLYVLNKRADGYHNLETLFQFLDFGDELSFQLNDSDQIARSYDFGFSEQVDLCLRAAQLIKPFAPSQAGVTIGLNKRLPMGGGLGGGSSNAATVLLALNHLWGVGLTIDQLADIGLTLGADVPFFLRGSTAWGSGVGELLEPINLTEQMWLVIYPQTEVSTARIFSNKRLTPHPQMKKIRALKMAIKKQPLLVALASAENQLEPIVRAEFPDVDVIFEWLSQQLEFCGRNKPRLSGSGGAVFVPLASREFGQKLLSNLPKKCGGFIAKGVNSHCLFVS